MVAFDEKLRLAENADEGSGGAAPDAFARVARIPIHDVADAAIGLVIEAGFRGGDETGMAGHDDGVDAAKHGGVELQPVMQIAHGENIDVFVQQSIDQRIAGEEIADDIVIKRIARFEQALVDLRESRLQFAEIRFDRSEIKYAHVDLQPSGE